MLEVSTVFVLAEFWVSRIHLIEVLHRSLDMNLCLYIHVCQ